jgi:cold shock CspA family protein
MSSSFARTTGRVKFFDATKGFGFISPNDGGEDVFVHQTSIHAEGFRSLGEGEEVEFNLEADPKKGKTFASNVTGPNGTYVKGAPREPKKSNYGDDYRR